MIGLLTRVGDCNCSKHRDRYLLLFEMLERRLGRVCFVGVVADEMVVEGVGEELGDTDWEGYREVGGE